MKNIKDFGAVGDGVTDDSAAIQSALSSAVAGDVVLIPALTYLCGKGAGMWCLNVPAGVRVVGEDRAGSVLKQAGGLGGSVRLLENDGPGVQIQNLTLDGNKTAQTVDEHRAGVFTQGADATIRGVTARNFTGDGFYFYHKADRFVVDDCMAVGNDRNGTTLGGAINGGTVTRSQFVGSRAQQFDSEPVDVAINGIRISQCLFDGLGVSTDYVLTVSGGAADVQSHDWIVEDCVVNGGINNTWASGTRIRRNSGTNPTNKSHVLMYRTCDDVLIDGNDFVSVMPEANGAISVLGSGEGGPSRVSIRRNRIAASICGIRAEGAVSVEASDNQITGLGVPLNYAAGIFVRATVPTRDFKYAIFHRNVIREFGQYGIEVWGNGAARLNVLDIRDNVFDTVTSMTVAMSLNDGTGCVKDARVLGSVLLGGCVLEVSALPSGTAVSCDSARRWLTS